MDKLDLQLEFDEAATIEDATRVVLKTLAYGHRGAAMVMANVLRREAMDKDDPKPTRVEELSFLKTALAVKCVETSKAQLAMIGEVFTLTRKQHGPKEEKTDE